MSDVQRKIYIFISTKNSIAIYCHVCYNVAIEFWRFFMIKYRIRKTNPATGKLHTVGRGKVIGNIANRAFALVGNGYFGQIFLEGKVGRDKNWFNIITLESNAETGRRIEVMKTSLLELLAGHVSPELARLVVELHFGKQDTCPICFDTGKVLVGSKNLDCLCGKSCQNI